MTSQTSHAKRDAYFEGLRVVAFDEIKSQAEISGSRGARKFGKLIAPVLLVTLLAVVSWIRLGYMSPTYSVHGRMVVHSMQPQQSSDTIAQVTGLGQVGAGHGEVRIIESFLRSPEMVEALERDGGFSRAYETQGLDLISRLRPQATLAEKTAFWNRQLSMRSDMQSGLIEFELRGYDPERTSTEFARAIVAQSEALVDRMTREMRDKVLKHAEQDATEAEDRLRGLLANKAKLRSETRLDPSLGAQAREQIDGGLEKEIADLRARIAVLAPQVSSRAPQLRALRDRLSALEGQLQGSASASRQTDLAAQAYALGAYEEIEIEIDLARRAYEQAQSRLEIAQAQADMQSLYLSSWIDDQTPRQADHVSIFPDLALWWLGASAIFAVFWALGLHLRESRE